INESYPLPLLISGMLILVLLSIFTVYKLDCFKRTFTNDTSFSAKVYATLPWVIIALFSLFFVNSKMADFSENRYNNELARADIYSFFAAFRNNELPYKDFYKTIPKEQAFAYVKSVYKNE